MAIVNHAQVQLPVACTVLWSLALVRLISNVPDFISLFMVTFTPFEALERHCVRELLLPAGPKKLETPLV